MKAYKVLMYRFLDPGDIAGAFLGWIGMKVSEIPSAWEPSAQRILAMAMMVYFSPCSSLDLSPPAIAVLCRLQSKAGF